MPEIDLYLYVGYVVQALTLLDVYRNFVPDLLDDFNRENLIRALNPITLLIGEFYGDALALNLDIDMILAYLNVDFETGIDIDINELLEAFWWSFVNMQWLPFAEIVFSYVPSIWDFPIVVQAYGALSPLYTAWLNFQADGGFS